MSETRFDIVFKKLDSYVREGDPSATDVMGGLSVAELEALDELRRLAELSTTPSPRLYTLS